MKKKWIITFLLTTVLLSSCASKESKKFINDDEIQAEISETIISLGQEKYDLELVPNMKKMKFSLQHGLPLVNDKKVTVPVKTVGNPVFTFNAAANIESDNSGYRGLGEIEIDNRGLEGLGEFLLERIFQEEYKSEIKTVMDYDKGISLKDVQVLSKASVFIENTQKKDKVIYSMTKDYNEGDFNDAEKYAELLEKHMLEINNFNGEEYLPELSFLIKKTYMSNESFVEKFNKVILFVRENENLPKGWYSFEAESDDEAEGELSELIKITSPK
jgi:hypothetical protein